MKPWLALVLPMMAVLLPLGLAQVVAQAGECDPSVGVGGWDVPHRYALSSPALFPDSERHFGRLTAHGIDTCPDHYDGELDFGINGAWLFARAGPSADGGDGVVACYGSTDPTAGPTTGHHGAHDTINVRDDFRGGEVSFYVTRDYNRSEDNPVLPASNNAGDFDCGDGLVEPCGDTPPGPEGCNPLDASELVWVSTGPYNAWSTASGTLADFAGADGAIVLFFKSTRWDWVAGKLGYGSTGSVWTSW
jgi:hypothetical protein